MKSLIFILIFTNFRPSFALNYQRPPNDSHDSIRIYHSSPCQAWSFSKGRYYCSFYSSFMPIADGNEINLIISQLKERIDQLEQKVNELSNK